VTFPAVVTLRGDGRPGVESQQRFYFRSGPSAVDQAARRDDGAAV